MFVTPAAMRDYIWTAQKASYELYTVKYFASLSSLRWAGMHEGLTLVFAGLTLVHAASFSGLAALSGNAAEGVECEGNAQNVNTNCS